MLDNIAGLVLVVSMLSLIFGFPVDFALRYMVPGTAIGVMIGDLLFFWLAFRYAKRTGRTDVTAMPLGLDTPSTIGMVLFVLGPAFLAAKAEFSANGGMTAEAIEKAAATQAWQIGICAIFISGLIKLMMALGSNWVRAVFPRAGLLGSLAAIALCLITFTQMTELAANPIVGFAALVMILVTLIARGKLPFQIPGALAAVLVGCACWYLMLGSDNYFGSQLLPGEAPPIEPAWWPTEWMQTLTLDWFGAMGKTVNYLPYVIPFAIATVIGGIDCAESAASVGDDFQTSNVIGIEALATLAASLCGGVIQTTPYIGHPAYKAMGGRAAYTLATALFVGGAGVIGYFAILFVWIPKAAVLPILIFIGLEITAQSFHATPKRHYAALAIACIPALAKLIMIYLGQYMNAIDYDVAIEKEKITAGDKIFLSQQMMHLSVLAGGFILTSLIWASALAKIIDRRFMTASVFLAIGGLLVLFGVMHSPLAGDRMFLPWNLWEENGDFTDETRRVVLQFAAAYLVMSCLIFVLGLVLKNDLTPIDTDEEFEKLGN